MSEEQRRFQRILHDANLQLELPRHTVEAHLVDLSLQGCLIVFPETIPDGLELDQVYPLHIRLSDETSISVQATVANLRSENTVALVFETIDLDSITCLKRLVELNLGDSQLLNRDMVALVHSES